MAKVVDLQAVVKHIVNGTFGDSLCRLCLLPLGECYEDVFTKVCKEDEEYCIADVLNEVCQVQIIQSDKYKVCSDCFFEASAAYKFYLLSKRTEEILEYYVNELSEHIESISVPEECSSDSICIKMPMFAPHTELFNYDLSGLCSDNNDKQFQDLHNNALGTVKLKDQDNQFQDIHNDVLVTVKLENNNKQFQELHNILATVKLEKEIFTKRKNIDAGRAENAERQMKMEKARIIKEEDDDIVIIMSEDHEQSFFTINEDDSLVPLHTEDMKPPCIELHPSNLKQKSSSESSPTVVNGKRRRKRNPMDYKKCSQCPIKYRFVAKLKEHMKTDHNIDIFVCKVCKAIIENEDEFNNHLKTHTDMHRCSTCNAVFKKRETIIAHFKSHEAMKELSKATTARVCEICGWILKDEASLREHHEDKHVKKYTCYYCGRMYKGEISFDVHIKKHEAHLNLKQKRNSIYKKESTKEKTPKRRYECTTCSKNFVDERSLMWHQRLHTDERPYVCEVCGRGFVSVNRRNQHALCAHTAPARRCPLCPALFHLRSMVNSHIKKVHLQTHKRRSRTSKYQNVFWRTETVPFQDLSVAVQNDILELKTNQTRRVGSQARGGFKPDEDFLNAYCTVKVPYPENSTPV